MIFAAEIISDATDPDGGVSTQFVSAACMYDLSAGIACLHVDNCGDELEDSLGGFAPVPFSYHRHAAGFKSTPAPTGDSPGLMPRQEGPATHEQGRKRTGRTMLRRMLREENDHARNSWN